MQYTTTNCVILHITTNSCSKQQHCSCSNNRIATQSSSRKTLQSYTNTYSYAIQQRTVFHHVSLSWVPCCLLDFGFCCDSFSIYIMIHQVYIYTSYICILIGTLISPFLCLRYTICFSYCVYYLLFLFVFLLR